MTAPMLARLGVADQGQLGPPKIERLLKSKVAGSSWYDGPLFITSLGDCPAEYRRQTSTCRKP